MPNTVDEYIAQAPPELQPRLQRLRAIIREAAPQAVEKISYNMPGYALNGYLIGFGLYKRHIGLYPRTGAMLEAIPELAGFKGTKGSIHLPLDQPLPEELVRKIVQVRVEETA